MEKLESWESKLDEAPEERRERLRGVLRAVDQGLVKPAQLSRSALTLDLVFFLLEELPDSMIDTRSLVLQVLGVGGAA